METETEVAAVEIAFDERGLVPCITQDWATGEVLTLAYMNRQALERTLASGEVHFWSRSRDELWRKGDTSGNVQRLRSIRYDCDADALLALVEPAGPACHTGERTCFYRTLEGRTTFLRGGGASPATAPSQIAPHQALPALGRTLERRRGELPE